MAGDPGGASAGRCSGQPARAGGGLSGQGSEGSTYPAADARQLAALRPPGPDRWLPAPILAEIRRRAAELADLGVCTRRATLVFAGPARITLRTRPIDDGPSPGRACARMGVVTTLERDPDGTLTYTNGLVTNLTGILHRGR
ncbi:hypothetical protein [Nocardia miyunensis]|uniref:hypothetical protein n=1 Tax=Nocardia miyunensis TaxID=282684 RepID=UPI00082A0118|nr:hypothetical protein [Nocardia miyunensis]